MDFTPGSATVYYRLQSRLNYSIQSTVYISLQTSVFYSLQHVVYYNLQPTVFSLLQPASYSGLHSWPYFSHEHCFSTPGSLSPRHTQKCGKSRSLKKKQEVMASYRGQLLAPAEDFSLWPRICLPFRQQNRLIMLFWQS